MGAAAPYSGAWSQSHIRSSELAAAVNDPISFIILLMINSSLAGIYAFYAEHMKYFTINECRNRDEMVN